MDAKERFELINLICERAINIGYISRNKKLGSLMDIERADNTFDLDLVGFLQANDFDFCHDFFGIANHVDRRTLRKGERLTEKDWDYFVPRFARV